MNTTILRNELNGFNNNNSTVFVKNDTIDVYEYNNGEVRSFDRYDSNGQPLVTMNMIEEILNLN